MRSSEAATVSRPEPGIALFEAAPEDIELFSESGGAAITEVVANFKSVAVRDIT